MQNRADNFTPILTAACILSGILLTLLDGMFIHWLAIVPAIVVGSAAAKNS